MGNYYCLMAGLPDIALSDTKPGCAIAELREQCDEFVSERDKRVLFYFFLRRDCRNLARLLKDPEAEVTLDGNYTMEQYRDLMTSAREMNFNVHRYPSFMSVFAREHAYNKGREGYFPEDEIAYRFLAHAIATCPSRMAREWYRLELDVTNILTAMLARRQGWAPGDYIKGEGEVQDMIRENKTKDFDLTHEFDYVRDLMRIVEEEDPVRKERMTDALKWEWLDERTFFEPFSVDALFAYLCKLEMQSRWAALDAGSGKETFRRIVDNLRGEAKVPEEFK